MKVEEVLATRQAPHEKLRDSQTETGFHIFRKASFFIFSLCTETEATQYISLKSRDQYWFSVLI